MKLSLLAAISTLGTACTAPVLPSPDPERIYVPADAACGSQDAAPSPDAAAPWSLPLGCEGTSEPVTSPPSICTPLPDDEALKHLGFAPAWSCCPVPTVETDAGWIPECPEALCTEAEPYCCSGACSTVACGDGGDQ